MKHKVLILSLDNQPQFLGGIKRVCSMLGQCWIERNLAKVEFATFCTSEIRKPMIGHIPQTFFPNATKFYSRENADFLVNKVNGDGFTIMLNPHVEDQQLNEFVARVRPQLNARIVGALHFAPTHNSDLIRESFFNVDLLGRNVKAWILQCGLWLKYKLYGQKSVMRAEMSKHVYAIKHCDRYVVLSERFIPMFPQSVRDKIVSINNPSPLGCTANVALEKDKKKEVVWCGRLDVNGAKRCDRMLKIWKMVQDKCPDWQLTILGNGNKDLIRSLIKKHRINNVKVVGFCSPFDYYEKSSILCSTSTVEGWGMVLVEAQSCGCVPIAFDSYASVCDIIEDGVNGVLVKPFDLQEYADKLIYVMKNQSARETMARRGLETVSRFKTDIVADVWIRLFDKLHND